MLGRRAQLTHQNCLTLGVLLAVVPDKQNYGSAGRAHLFVSIFAALSLVQAPNPKVPLVVAVVLHVAVAVSKFGGPHDAC